MRQCGAAGTPERVTVRTYPQMVVALLCLGAAAAVGLGEPYWVSYEANAGFPEDEGWTRYTSGGGAQRWFEDGALVIDTLANPGISEAYGWWRPGALDPDPGQYFVAAWRLCLSQLQGTIGASVGIYSDQRRAAAFDIEWDGVHVGGVGTVATFEPGVFHDFEFRSPDLLTYYALYVDGVLVYTGAFWTSVSASLVHWGESTQGEISLTHWDYVRFGVVPEPLAFWLVLSGSLVILKPRG